jgi:cytidine deaminase
MKWKDLNSMANPKDTLNNLIDTARQSMAKAYAPYSNFMVGASILDENGQIHAGCNVENSAYPLGVCAEGSAISNMILNGGTQIDKILIVSSGDKMVTPCGGCRQKIREFATPQTRILIHHKGEVTEFSVADLLPHSFSKEHFIK